MVERVPDTASGYGILGCGSVGYEVAQDLLNRGKEITIIDKDESRVESLRDQDLNAIQMDIRDPEATEEVSDRHVVLILTDDTDANAEALENLRETGREQYIVVRASDPVSQETLIEKGADSVINPPTVIAQSALRAVETGEMEYRVSNLVDVIKSTDGKMAILVYDSPDPDSIASAVALESIAESFDVEAEILYKGDLGHRENQAFVNLLEIELTRMDDVSLDDYGTVAVYDHVENVEEEGTEVDIFIDNRSSEYEVDADFEDVRPNLGSTSTIMTKYIQETEANVPNEVPTALLYGIRTATDDFRNTAPADLTAAAYLYALADNELLEQIESPSMSPETFDVLADSIHNREVRSSYLISNAGYINDNEALIPAADHLLSLEGVNTTAVFGITDDYIHIAARSNDIRINIARVLEDSFGGIGEVAGHTRRANARVPLGLFKGIGETGEDRETLLELTAEAVESRIFDSIGVEEERD
ncbi:MAG: DHH family phosphoesterase [Halobacteria archaeon]|nr:DHH family phosphoesterase [Halobacteria archaeon]